MANMINVVNAILAQGSQEYKARVPVATQDNISAVANPILTQASIRNEFLLTMVNKFALTEVKNMTYNNPLKVLKKGGIPLGVDVEEVHTNMAKAKTFDPTGATLLARAIPDVKVIYHRINREDQYEVTVTKKRMVQAFSSWSALNDLLTSMINTLYSGDNRDEFIITKNLIASAVTDGKVVKLSVPHIHSTNGAKDLVKSIRTLASNFTYPSSAYNKYLAFKPDYDTSNTPVETWCPKEDQILLIRSDIMTEIDVEVLAQAFNMDKTTFLANTLEVDNFGSATNVYALLCDKSFFKIYDNDYSTDEFHNPKGAYDTYYLNHWGTYSISLFANAVALCCDDEAITVDKATLSFVTSATQTITATTTPVDADVAWMSSNEGIATVVDGVVTPVENGTCLIFAINGDKIASTAVTVNIP